MEAPVFPLSLGRRRVIRTLLVGAAASVMRGRAWHGTLMAAVAPRSGGAESGFLRLRLADFTVLQGSFGSVRLGFTATNVLGPMRPFIVTRDSSRFYCVSAECTHAGTLIPAFSAAGKRSICPNHGSRFALDGSVLFGPATEPLTAYPVEVLEDGFLRIELLDFPSYGLTIEKVLEGGGSRVAVSFLAQRNVEYEVLGASAAGGPWEPVSFATSVFGLANARVVKGPSGGAAPLTVWVERTAESMVLAVSARVRSV